MTMQKIFALLIAFSLSLLAGSLAIAAPDAHGNISKTADGVTANKTVSAYVTPYAEFSWGDFVAPAHLSGQANEQQIGSLKVSAVANCAVDIILDVTPMTSQGENHDASTLTTLYAVTTGTATPVFQNLVDFGNEMVVSSALDQSSDTFTISYQVVDGEQVYSQHAGDYSAKIKLTVVAQAY